MQGARRHAGPGMRGNLGGKTQNMLEAVLGEGVPGHVHLQEGAGVRMAQTGQ